MHHDEAANPGLLRPPLIYVAFGLLGIAAHTVWPWPLALDGPGYAVGTAVLLLSGALLMLTLRTFKSHHTPFPGTRPTTAVIETGPFKFSRNPAYLAFSAILFGLSLLVQTLWLWVALICAVLIVDRLVIPREEAYLDRHFGETYQSYRQRVRRWF